MSGVAQRSRIATIHALGSRANVDVLVMPNGDRLLSLGVESNGKVAVSRLGPKNVARLIAALQAAFPSAIEADASGPVFCHPPSGAKRVAP